MSSSYANYVDLTGQHSDSDSSSDSAESSIPNHHSTSTLTPHHAHSHNHAHHGHAPSHPFHPSGSVSAATPAFHNMITLPGSSSSATSSPLTAKKGHGPPPKLHQHGHGKGGKGPAMGMGGNSGFHDGMGEAEEFNPEMRDRQARGKDPYRLSPGPEDEMSMEGGKMRLGGGPPSESFADLERRKWAAAVLDDPEMIMMFAQSRSDSVPAVRLHFTRIMCGVDDETTAGKSVAALASITGLDAPRRQPPHLRPSHSKRP